MAGAALFQGLPESEAAAQGPGPDPDRLPGGDPLGRAGCPHPNAIGDLKIVGPDVTHPNFIYWDKDSVSCPKDLLKPINEEGSHHGNQREAWSW